MREGGQVAALAGLDVFTMPPKVAARYESEPKAGLSSQVETDPVVRFGTGVALDDFRGGVLWDVPAPLEESVERLLAEDLDALGGDDVREHFAQAGYADLFPLWSEGDIHTARTEGKIPVFTSWRAGLAGGRLGLDALMNLSAFQSFATDQKALDDRIRSLI
jgi:hypothetical protein